MIFDRTQEHVERAKVLISEKVKQGQTLTDDDIAVLERGTLTINTLNRIEAKSKELHEKLNEATYYSGGIDTKEYTYNDIFIESDFQKMLDNLDVIVKSYYTKSDTPSIPSAQYHFENFNAIEKILYDIEEIYNSMLGKYRECGTFVSGEEDV